MWTSQPTHHKHAHPRRTARTHWHTNALTHYGRCPSIGSLDSQKSLLPPADNLSEKKSVLARRRIFAGKLSAGGDYSGRRSYNGAPASSPPNIDRWLKHHATHKAARLRTQTLMPQSSVHGAKSTTY